jgi:hypothetical protein
VVVGPAGLWVRALDVSAPGGCGSAGQLTGTVRVPPLNASVEPVWSASA